MRPTIASHAWTFSSAESRHPRLRPFQLVRRFGGLRGSDSCRRSRGIQCCRTRDTDAAQIHAIPLLERLGRGSLTPVQKRHEMRGGGRGGEARRRKRRQVSSNPEPVSDGDLAVADYYEEFDDEANAADIRRLFDMGFISLEEVETFDPKKFPAEQDQPLQLQSEDDAMQAQPASKETVADTQKEIVLKNSGKWTVTKRIKPERATHEKQEKHEKQEQTTKHEKQEQTKKHEKQEQAKKKEKQKQVVKDSKGKQDTNTKPAAQPKQPHPSQPTAVLPDELPEWRAFNLHPLLLSALKDAGFTAPMPIQSSTLKSVLQDGSKHLMASAPTGSGKTLAFGLAILDYIFKSFTASSRSEADGQGKGKEADRCNEADDQDNVAAEQDNDADDQDKGKDNETADQDNAPTRTHQLAALILVPTRELAIQIERHLKVAAKFSSFCNNSGGGKAIRIASVIGGMSAEKQDRLLASNPHIVIATPGRLAEAMEFDGQARRMLCTARFLVLDEADRLIQPGHFRELDDILAKVLATPRADRQIFLFSATLAASKDSSNNNNKKKSPFAKLLDRLSLDRAKAAKEAVAVLDLAGRPSTLHEWQCPSPSQLDKDALVLYFLEDLRKEQQQQQQQQQATGGKFGRVLMFVNAIETIRRLTPLFALLGIPTLGLHAQMQQRQRLKNLDRFKAAQECLLIASDVAARGLDIQGIQHVIHYHLPKDKETYVHRCGRTARASQAGASLALFAPEERSLAESCGLLGGAVPRFVVDESFVGRMIGPAVRLARRIESLQHTERATNAQVSWAEKAAEELGIELDADNDPSWKQRQQHQARGLDQKQTKKEIERATRELTLMLEEMRREF